MLFGQCSADPGSGETVGAVCDYTDALGAAVGLVVGLLGVETLDGAVAPEFMDGREKGGLGVRRLLRLPGSSLLLLLLLWLLPP